MFARAGVLSLVLPFLLGQAKGQSTQGGSALELDVSNQDSIKAAAKALAGGIVSAYDETVADTGIPGLFDDPYYFWEAGVVFNALIGYSHLTGDSQYDQKVSQALQHQIGDFDAFMPPNQTKSLGNDDQSSWGLAAMTAAEVGFPKPDGAEWIDYAKNVFDIQAERLNIAETDECQGGLRWQIFTFNMGYNYKGSWSNGNFFLLAARLAKFTGNATYTQYADKVYKWSQDIGFVTDDYSVYDGASTLTNCTKVNKIRWTAHHGAYTEGAALMYNLTGAQNWTNAVRGFVNASSVFQDDDNSALVEVACESAGTCDIDQRAFKGMFARTFARAAVAAPIVAESIRTTLSASAKGAASACINGEDIECSIAWNSDDSMWETASAKDFNLGEVYAALEVIQGLLYPSAKALRTVGSAGSDTGGGNSTQNGTASSVSGSGAPQSTGAAGTVSVSVAMVLAGTFAAALMS